MAPKGKKGKKGQTVNLADFLSQQAPSNTVATTIQVRGAGSWADEVDEDDGGVVKQVFLPTAPRAAMEFNDDHVPYNPPYTAHIANLSYDTDEQQVKECFERARMKVQTVRLMKDEGGRLKGFGYIDFEDRDSLVDALQMNEFQMTGRKVRIDLATGAGKERGGGGFDRGDRGERRGWGDRDRGGGRGGDDPDAGRSDANDWRSAPPPPTRDDPRDNRSRGGFDRFDSDRDRDRGFGGFRDRDDRGGRGFDRYSRRSPEAPKERPRIVLQPRTVKKEEDDSKPAAQENSGGSGGGGGGSGGGGASIFGSAKPVDTTAKEKEIEEKMGKMEVKEESGGDKPGVYRPPGARDREDRRDGDRFGGGGGGGFGRRDDRGGFDRRDDRGGFDRRDRYDRDDRGGGGFDRYNRRDDRRDDRGYDRRDDRRDNFDRRDRGGFNRDRDDRRDDRGYDRRDNRDYDRRDDRGRDYDRRDDRDYDRRDDRDMDRRNDRDFRRDDRDFDRRDDRDFDRRDDRDSDRRDNRDSDRRDDRRDDRDFERRDDRGDDNDRRDNGDDRRSREGSADRESGMSKSRGKATRTAEEQKAPEVVGKNKFAFLQDEAGSNSDEE